VKRKVALGFLLFLIVVVGGTLATLRTRWAGDKICAVAAEKLSAAVGKPVDFGTCRIDPFSLTVSARNVRVGDLDAPLARSTSTSSSPSVRGFACRSMPRPPRRARLHRLPSPVRRRRSPSSSSTGST
jgi:hypothetical protein